MTPHSRSLPLWLTVLFLVVSAPVALAQNGGAQKKADEPVADDPLVQSVLESFDPETSSPEDLVQATKILLDLRHPAVARRYVAKLAAAKLDDDQLSQLGRKFGSAVFLKMSLQTELKPEAGQIADRVLDATRRVARDPKRLAAEIQRLKNPSVQERVTAIAELAYGSDAAVNALLGVLADAGRADEHANVREALVALASHSVEPLIGALETSDPALKAQVIAVLHGLDARAAWWYLLAPAVGKKVDENVRKAAQAALADWANAKPTVENAIAALIDQARYYYGGGRPKLPDFDGNIALWHWDATQTQAVRREYPADDASMAAAHRLAGELLELAPDSREAKYLYLASLLQLAKYQNGLAKPLPAGKGAARDAAATFGAEAIEDVMVQAMTDGRAVAATAAATILGDIGNESLLQSRGGKPSPLVQAAMHADRRLRLAAAAAIVNLKPTKPFAFSHVVPQTLAFLAGTTGELKVLVTDASAEEARRMAGLLAELDFDGEIAISAGRMVKRAVASPDFALVLFNTNLPYANPDLLIQQLRKDHRTALMPVGLITVGGDVTAVERLAQKYPRTAVFVRTRSVGGMASQVKRLLDKVGRDFVSREERVNQARQALALLGQLTAEEESLFDVRPYEAMLERPLFVPELGVGAAAVMANLGTAFSQRALVDVASNSPLPLQLRQAAAAAFARSCDAHGILLTRKQILRQYDYYNASEFLDKETQNVLASILDTIELAATKKKADGSKQKAVGSKQ